MIDNDIEQFLALLRDVNPRIIDIFTKGGCFELYRIMKLRWPDAEPWYAWQQGHVYTKIGKRWYDIRGSYAGVVDKVAFAPMDWHSQAKAMHWKKTIDDKLSFEAKLVAE